MEDGKNVPQAEAFDGSSSEVCRVLHILLGFIGHWLVLSPPSLPLSLPPLHPNLPQSFSELK